MTSASRANRPALVRVAALLTVAGAALSSLGGSCLGRTAPHPELLRHQKACVEYLQKGDNDGAEIRCELCLDYDGNNPECLNGMGLVWFYRGVDDKARTYFKRAITVFNDFAEARNNLGVLEFRSEDYRKARQLFASAVAIDPAYLDGRYNLALSLLRLGQLERGRQIKLPESKRDFSQELLYYEEAEPEYRKIFELEPQHANAYHDMGVISSFRAEDSTTENERTNQTGEAERFFKRCIAINPNHEECHGNLAHLYLATGRYDESLFHFVQCLAANPKNPTCGTELAEAYRGASLRSASIRRYIDQIRENPGYAPAHYGLCLAFFSKGLVDMAVVECENTIKLDSGHCMAHFQLAEHYRKVLDKDRAVNYCRAFIGCDTEQHPAELETCKETVRALEAQ